MEAKRYRVVRGLDYPVKGRVKRADPGDIVTDIPEKSLPWLLKQGHIEPVEEGGGEKR